MLLPLTAMNKSFCVFDRMKILWLAKRTISQIKEYIDENEKNLQSRI